MTKQLIRRDILSGGAGLAATAALIVPTMRKSSREGQDPSATVVVRWNSKTQRWARRPARAEFGVVFLSTNDPAAVAPTDPGVLTGDVWRLHPDAVLA